MRTIFYLIISLAVSFLLSLFFDTDTGKLVLVLCGSMFFCTLYLANLIVRGIHAVMEGQRTLYNKIK